MRKSMDRTGRGVVCAPAALALPAALSSAAAAPAFPRESARLRSAERFHVTRHGGIARAANSSITCAAGTRGAAGGCATAQKGGAGANVRYRMAYVDVDSDRNTYNSGRARLRIPAGSRISHARLYRGGNLRAGERKPAKSVQAGRHRPYAVHNAADPANDVMNSTVTEFGRESARQPACRNTLGPDSDVFDLRPALRSGGSRLAFRFSAHRPGYLLGALFVQTDTRR
ncbi:hypothetical protein [Streptomyces sp. NRRL S-337]|uniref:hypothetical protein n=1 Tax=Streptomyces sp. NRRL S-337 TaxID=1463900 RepID=UPI0004CB6B10|nr:hypothetical protein [Streptomyces sp. NRRL S-337]